MMQQQTRLWPWKQGAQNFDYSLSTIWPRLTIVTPSFNQAKYLEQTIQSVMFQKYPNLEYIVIDGGSTDGSVEIIRKYADQLSYWISEPDYGQSDALNKGFTLATGDWFAWINSDDFYLPNAFGNVMQYSVQNPDSEWIVGTTCRVGADMVKLKEFLPLYNAAKWRNPDFPTGSWLDFVCVRQSGTVFPQQSSFWKATAWRSAGGLDPAFHFAMDFELYGRLAYYGYSPVILDLPISAFRLHKEQKTYQGRQLFLQEELKSVDLWLNRPLSDYEHQILIDYHAWLTENLERLSRRRKKKSKFYLWVKGTIKKILSMDEKSMPKNEL